MKTLRTLPFVLTTLLAVSAFAQTTVSEVQRDANQQKRIESGLKTGQLTTREAAKLEKEEAHIDHAEANAMKDGHLSNSEKRRIERMQDKASHDIHSEKHDAQTGNPNSASSKRMQANVQRNVAQQQRIENGLQNGSLTNREAGKLEHGQAHVDRRQYRAGRDGHVSKREEAKIQRSENHQSHRIHHEKHDREHRG